MQAEKDTYLLDAKDTIILDNNVCDIELDKIVYFPDIAQPQSIALQFNRPSCGKIVAEYSSWLAEAFGID